MKRRMRNISIYLFIIFLCHSGLTYGWQEGGDTPDIKALRQDTTTIKTRAFSGQKIQKFKNDSDFNYGRSPKLKTNLWQRFLQWIIENLGKIFSVFKVSMDLGPKLYSIPLLVE